MRPKNTGKKMLSPSITHVIRKSVIIYLIAIVTLPVICFVFGFKTLDNIGTGFMYGSLGVVIFGALTFAGNTVPGQLSKLSLPKHKAPSVKHHEEADSDKSTTREEID